MQKKDAMVDTSEIYMVPTVEGAIEGLMICGHSRQEAEKMIEQNEIRQSKLNKRRELERARKRQERR